MDLKPELYNCGHCNIALISLNDLKDHLMTSHKNFEKIKSNGNQEAKNNDSQRQKIFKCNSCDKEYKTRSALGQHVKVSHLGLLKKCTDCDKTFTNNNSLKDHQKFFHEGTDNYKCDMCSSLFPTKSNLRRHKISVHDFKRAFECETCPKAFKCKKDLDNHEDIHKGKRYECKECGLTFSNKPNLGRHVRLIHINGIQTCPSQYTSRQTGISIFY